MRKILALTIGAAAIAPVLAQAGILSPMTTFGGGDGYIAPGDRAYVTVGDTQRSLAFNRSSGNLVLVNRQGGLSINLINGLSGNDMGALNQGVGIITGGTFTGLGVGVGDDGAIYMGNLTTNTTTSAFKMYRWANEGAAAPTVAFTGAPLAGARLGDNLEVRGSGVNTQIIAGYNSAPAVAGNNSFASFSTVDGSNYTSTHVAIAGAIPAAGDYRLGLTFIDSDTVIGALNSNSARLTDFVGASGTLVSTIPLATPGSTERGMDYTIIGGVGYLATLQTGSANSTLRVYDMTTLTSPVLVATGFTQNVPFTANANGSSSVAWGVPFGDGSGAALYGMNTNNGIQAMEFYVPEPTSLSLIGAGALLALRRNRK